MMMQIRPTRKPAHPTHPLQTATSGLFFAVLSGQKSNTALPPHESDDPDVITDGSRTLILGELYLQNWR
jgi:hypothetical protein